MGGIPARVQVADPAGIRPVVLALAVLLAACAGSDSGAPTAPAPSAMPAPSAEAMTVYVDGGGAYTSIPPRELVTVLETQDVVLVNVHVPYEGEIEGTDAFIPFDQVAARLGELPVDRTAPVVLYCRTGRMSTVAAERLVGLGFTNIVELAGGFEAWRSAGYPLVDGAGGG